MANGMVWLVTFESGSIDSVGFDDLEDALCHMRDHRGDGPLLWARSDIGLISPGAEPASAPKKKRSPRKRKESPDSSAAAPAAPSAAAASSSGEVPARAREQDGRAGAELRPAASLPCGGARCREKGTIVIHDANDPSCTKMHPKRTAAR